MTKSPILPMKLHLTRVATPLGFEPRITPPKGAVLPLHHGVNWLADLRFSTARRKLQLCAMKTLCVVSTQMSGTRRSVSLHCRDLADYSLGFGRRMSIVVPLPQTLAS